MKKVAVITTLNHNPGDDYIRFGVYHILASLLKGAQIVELHKHDATKDRVKTQEVIDWADTVIQAGTPCYWCNPGHHSGKSEWANPIWREILFHDSSKQVINIGAGSYFGYYAEGGGALRNHEYTAYIEKMTTRSNITTVRDSLAESMLARMGFDVPLLLCPATWGQDYIGNAKTIEKDKKLIVGSFQSNAGHFNFNNVALDAQRFARLYRTVITSLSKDFKVIIVSHSEKDLMEARMCLPDMEHHLISTARSQDSLAIYARASMYIGTRIHGAFSVISNGSPAILFCSDSRSRMMDLVNMPRYFVNDLPGPEELVQLATGMITDEVSEKIQLIKERNFREYRKLFDI